MRYKESKIKDFTIPQKKLTKKLNKNLTPKNYSVYFEIQLHEVKNFDVIAQSLHFSAKYLH